MNPFAAVILLLSCSSKAAESWSRYGSENAEMVASAVAEWRTEEAIALIDEFPSAKGLLLAVCESHSLENLYKLSDYLKNKGYVPVKNEVSQAFKSLSTITQKTDKFLEQWADHLDFDCISKIVSTCVTRKEPIPAYLISVLNSSRPTLALSEKLASLLSEIMYTSTNVSLLENLYPFFGIVQRGDSRLNLTGAIYKIKDIELGLKSRKDILQNFNAENITNDDLESYLSTGNSSLEDLLEVAVMRDNYHLLNVNKEAHSTEGAEVVPVNTANAVAFLISKGADPFALDSINGEPLSALPNLSPEIRKILVTAQAGTVFEKVKVLLHTELIFDVIGEFAQNLIELEFQERKAKFLPLSRF